jgi:hypothetical protein
MLVLALVAVLWWLTTGDVPVISALQNIIGRGRRLTSTSLDGDGNISETPVALATAAGQTMGREVSPDAYTLARIADSEHPTGDIREKAAIMQVCINDAAAHGWSIEYCATVGKGYGSQAGRRYSTARDPYEATLILAEAVLSNGIPDETRGSTHFVHVTGFANFGAYQALCDKWQSSANIVPVKLPGINSFRLFLSANDYAPEDTLPEVASG